MAHAVGDATDLPIYGSHYLVSFPLLDADGDPISPSSPDSEVSIDLGTFADCTNEATELATSSGSCYLYLTGAEMTGSIITVQIKSTGAKTTVLSIHPVRLAIITTGTAQAGAAGTITLAAGTSKVDNDLAGMYVRLSNNSPAGVQYATRKIVSNVASTQVATVNSNWGTNPSSSTTYDLLAPVSANVISFGGTMPPTIATAGIQDVNTKNAGGTAWNSGAIGASTLASDTIAAAKIATGAITAAKFAAGAIDAAAIADGAIDAATFAAGAITATVIADGAIDAATFAAGAINAAAIATDAIDADALAADAVAEINATVDTALSDIFLDKLISVSGTADSGSTTTMVDAARTEADADYWKGQVIKFTSGNISGQCGIITDFNAGTDTFTFAPPTTQAVSTHTYVILPNVSAWDDNLAEHLASGTTGNALNAAGAAGDPWSTALPGAYGAGTAGHIVGTAIPDIAPGAANGLLISGSNSGTTTFGALTVTGATTLTGNVSLGGTLGVTGTVTFNAFTVTNATTLTGAVSLGSTLGVTGTTTLAALNTGAIGTGNVTITGTLSTSGTATFNALTVTNAFTVSGATTLTGNVSAAAGVTITQSSANASALVVTGNGTGHGALITGGSGATGDGVHLVSASTNGHGLWMTGTGSGEGLHVEGGATAGGASFEGGGTSGPGVIFSAQNGNSAGMLVTGAGTGPGIDSLGGGSAPGTRFTAGASTFAALQLTGAGLTEVALAATGNVSVSGTTTLTGAVSLGSTLGVTGAITATNASNNITLGTFTVTTNAIAWNAAWDTEVQSEAEDALVVHRLDELLNADSDIDGAAPPAVGSVFHELMTKTAGSFTFDQTTDSLEAIRDRGDAAWITATGFSTHTAADVWAVATRTLTAGTNIQLPSNGLDNVVSWTVAITGNITGNLSGSVGSVTGAVGSVTGAVGSVTGNVGGNVTGSVGSVLGGINTTAGVITTLDGLDTAQDTQHATTQAKTNLLPEGPSKNSAFTYVIKMVDSTDHVTPKTGLTVTMTRSIDGAAFGAATGTVTEISTGHYKVVASAADMNGDVVSHRFVGTAADDLTVTIQTTA